MKTIKKRSSTKQAESLAEMRSEYDFSGGVRGKHYKALQEGYTIRIRKTDGTVIETCVGGKGTIALAPDVREYFPTSQAVNRALRALISIVPRKQKAVGRKEPDNKNKRKLVAQSHARKLR